MKYLISESQKNKIKYNLHESKLILENKNSIIISEKDEDNIILEDCQIPLDIMLHEEEERLIGQEIIKEAVYNGEKVTLNKPKRNSSSGGKKYYVFVNSGKKDKDGKVKAKKVNFGSKEMEIKRDDPKRRKSFRARHKCATAKDNKTPRYWSCRFWQAGKTVSQLLKGK